MFVFRLVRLSDHQRLMSQPNCYSVRVVLRNTKSLQHYLRCDVGQNRVIVWAIEKNNSTLRCVDALVSAEAVHQGFVRTKPCR